MNTSGSPNPYQHHRFPAEIIRHGVWLYFRFCLSSRGVEELLFARGIIVTYEAIREWCRNSDKRRPISSGALGPATRGTWTGCCSPSMGHGTTSGARWTRMATCWTFSCNAAETRRPLRNSSGSCSKG
jgi:hypothetical protein